MIEEIDFQDSGNQVSVTIDNETQSLPIKKINKLSTYIELNQSLNTALENNIEVDAFIYYIKKTEETNIENEEINTEVTHEREYLYEDLPDNLSNDIKFLTGVDSNNLRLNIDGTVTITIYNGDEIYYIKDVHFIKGHITDSIINTLPLGTYTMVIQYNGNKYFQESSLTIEFNIEKRLATCELEKEQYYGDLLENINISGILKDSEKRTPISNCTFYYDFNGVTESATSDTNGNFSFNITVPAPDISHCNLPYESVDESVFEPGELYEEDAEEEFKDEDGNIRLRSDIEYPDETPEEQSIEITSDELNPEYEYPEDPDIEEYYPNTSYIINIYTDNASYYFNNTEIEIIANKAPTHIILDSTNPDEQTNILKITGTGFATYNNSDNDIKYGKINIELPDFNYKHDTINIENGIFTTDINLADVYSVYNNSDTVLLEPYDTTNIKNTSIKIEGDKNVSKGDMFTVKATVTAVGSTEHIKYGVLIFNLYSAHGIKKDEDTILYENDTNDDGTSKPPVYRYATEIDRTGIGVFNFNTSQSKAYNIQVEYIGMFGYQDSLSEKYSITVE